jgi:hypothetical protein
MNLSDFHPRTCTADEHPHGFPICAHALGLEGDELLDQSRWFSSIAGWPAALNADGLAELEAVVGRIAAPAAPQADGGAMMAAPRAPEDCGCG